MSATREIHYFDYVNADYQRVRDALQANTLGVCRAATTTPSSASSATAELRLGARGFDVGTEVNITMRRVEERPATPRSPETTTFTFDWQAATLSWLFPLMHAELMVYPVNATDTQLELVTRYDRPFGAFGAAMDALIGHHVANVCVDRFLADVAGHLRTALPPDARPH
jgi:hypothetical protein